MMFGFVPMKQNPSNEEIAKIKETMKKEADEIISKHDNIEAVKDDMLDRLREPVDALEFFNVDKPLGNCDRLGVVSRHKRLREHDCARSGGYSENCTYMSCSHLTPNSLTTDSN